MSAGSQIWSQRSRPSCADPVQWTPWPGTCLTIPERGPGTWATLTPFLGDTRRLGEHPPPAGGHPSSLWPFAPAGPEKASVLVELGLVEHRYAAVSAVLEPPWV